MTGAARDDKEDLLREWIRYFETFSDNQMHIWQTKEVNIMKTQQSFSQTFAAFGVYVTRGCCCDCCCKLNPLTINRRISGILWFI